MARKSRGCAEAYMGTASRVGGLSRFSAGAEGLSGKSGRRSHRPGYLATVPKSARIILMAPGPRMTINRDGKMNRARGRRILTGSFAAISSALCALLVLNESE